MNSRDNSIFFFQRYLFKIMFRIAFKQWLTERVEIVASCWFFRVNVNRYIKRFIISNKRLRLNNSLHEYTSLLLIYYIHLPFSVNKYELIHIAYTYRQTFPIFIEIALLVWEKISSFPLSGYFTSNWKFHSARRTIKTINPISVSPMNSKTWNCDSRLPPYEFAATSRITFPYDIAIRTNVYRGKDYPDSRDSSNVAQRHVCVWLRTVQHPLPLISLHSVREIRTFVI